MQPSYPNVTCAEYKEFEDNIVPLIKERKSTLLNEGEMEVRGIAEVGHVDAEKIGGEISRLDEALGEGKATHGSFRIYILLAAAGVVAAGAFLCGLHFGSGLFAKRSSAGENPDSDHDAASSGVGKSKGLPSEGREFAVVANFMENI